ncbi:SWIM zinc finger family protein [Chitinophaga sancti]|uniref:SWIM zinc finger family protein n=1 Tax=Chitinophaga sancti TaxID=1004 RepID=UPI002A7610D2|nr:SWIM zinc finger family protein [Chitinophaga sancti]WPQ63819.1 SWIM zinc finger family protein [Chitinophaga sancti]
MLTLKNFELQIGSVIIQRGRQYYEDGAVIDLEETDNNYWQAEVAGSTTYFVEIKLGNKNKIEDYSCDCPYDGDTCKHVVAVLFLLKEELSNTIVSAKRATQPDFKKLLQKINIEEYKEFILTHATKDKNFKSAF